MNKKRQIVRLLEKRTVVSFEELLAIVGNEDTTKKYIMELKEYGVIASDGWIKVRGTRVKVYCISKEGLEAYKQELERRRMKKIQNLLKFTDSPSHFRWSRPE